MNTQVATELHARTRRSPRGYAVSSLGPLTMLGGVVWTVLQPYRLTVLHPHEQSFWWLAVQPPLLVILVGVLFAVFVAPGVLEDLEEAEGR